MCKCLIFYPCLTIIRYKYLILVYWASCNLFSSIWNNLDVKYCRKICAAIVKAQVSIALVFCICPTKRASAAINKEGWLCYPCQCRRLRLATTVGRVSKPNVFASPFHPLPLPPKSSASSKEVANRGATWQRRKICLDFKHDHVPIEYGTNISIINLRGRVQTRWLCLRFQHTIQSTM